MLIAKLVLRLESRVETRRRISKVLDAIDAVLLLEQRHRCRPAERVGVRVVRHDVEVVHVLVESYAVFRRTVRKAVQ